MRTDSIEITIMIEKYLKDLSDSGRQFCSEEFDDILISGTYLGIDDRREATERAIEEWESM